MVQIGSTLGAYEIVAELKSGGMANLYLGRRQGPAGFSRHVVIKAVKAHLASHTDFIRMFLDEGRIAARIQHPNVVRIEELGEENGLYYLVMEYVHGAALSELLAGLAGMERRVTPDAAVAIIANAAAGLHAAHETLDERGEPLHVVHRDVSPQNILVGALGEVKIIDFGIAKARNRLHVTDASGGLKGKLRYMAPEQLMRTGIDRRADIYALAVVLWEMLTMRRLFEGKNDGEVITRIQQGQYPPPGAFADCPHELDIVIMDALSRNPDDRPSTAREFRQRLRNAVPGAASIENGDLAALLWGVVGDRLDKRANALPPGSAKTRHSIELEQHPDDMVARLTAPVGRVFEDASTVPSTFVAPPIEPGVQPTPEYYYPEHTPEPPVGRDRGGPVLPEPPSGGFTAPRPAPPGPRAAPPPPPQPRPQPAPQSNQASLILVALVGLLAGAVLVLGALLVFG